MAEETEEREDKPISSHPKFPTCLDCNAHSKRQDEKRNWLNRGGEAAASQASAFCILTSRRRLCSRKWLVLAIIAAVWACLEGEKKKKFTYISAEDWLPKSAA